MDPEIPDGYSSYEKGSAPKAHLNVVEPDVYQVTFGLEVESTGNRKLMQLRACYSETNEKPDTTDQIVDLFTYYREGEQHLSFTLAGLEPETEYHCRLYVANTDSGCYTNSIACMTKAPVGNSSWRAVAGIPWLTEKYTGGFTVGDRYFALSSRVFPDGRARLVEYLPDSDEWVERSGLPFGSRVQPVAVEAGGKGYAGLGDMEEPNETGGFTYYAQRDWWCYDPISNRWERKADIPVGTTGLMAAFGVDGKVYVVTSPDFWNSTPTYVLEYDTRSDRWSRKRDFPGDKLQEAASMVVDGRAFLFTGITNRMQEGVMWMRMRLNIYRLFGNMTCRPIRGIGVPISKVADVPGWWRLLPKERDMPDLE